MESFSGSEHGTAEIYMVQGTESNPHLASTSSLGQQFEVMGNEGAAEFIVDQGLYYPAATNYYGYYSTGFESAGEWDDNQRFLALDSPSIQYAGLQTENLPYVYYTPTYGYSQSPYNPYNPYIPGAVIGVDGSFVGMQQYYPGPTYQHSPSSPSYYPYLVQPVTENVPISAQEPHFLNVGVSNSNGSDGSGLKQNLQEAPGGTTKLAPRPPQVDVDKASNQSNSHGKRSEASKTTVTNSKQPATNKSTATLSVSHATSSQATQGRHASGAVQGSDQLTFGQIPPLHSPAKVPTPVTNASADFRSSTRGWPMADKLRPRLQYGGVSNNGNGNPDFYNEQNRGPRINKSRGQWTQSSFVDGYTANGGTSGTGGEIIIHPDQYNKEDFPVSYTDGKFFVIKSYSEDDVHKSIKYGVWSSTPNGNKRLDSAYGDAQRIAAGVPRGCPIFLFFSVNASGQFCGVAEMVGPVDFNKDMNFWQQDKWSGSFPVKWHIIKDVPNTNFRHIILENNENKPVTNSRDTQEIKFRPGMEMLNIFKNYTSKTSILDDFLYYEERQKILQEEKARRHGKSYDSSFYMPAFVPMRKPIVGDDQNESAKSFNHPSSSGRTGAAVGEQVSDVGEQVSLKSGVTNSSSHEEDSTKCHSVQDEKGLTSVMKIGSLTIDPKPVEAKPAAAVTVAITKAVDVFTVGSMPVKVNGFSEASSATLTVGSIPIVPKGLTCDKPSTESSSGGV